MWKDTKLRDLYQKENTEYEDFYKLGFKTYGENDEYLYFLNLESNIVLTFNKQRKYAFQCFGIEDGELVFYGLDIEELQPCVNLLKEKGFIY